MAATPTTMTQAMAAQVPPSFDNASVWHNFTAWTAQHLGYAVNMSRLAPSLEDLVWAGPRMVMKLGRLGSFISFPDAIDGFGQRVISESTDAGAFPPLPTAMSGAPTADSLPIPTPDLEQDPNAFVARLSTEGVKGLGNVFSYATSKWALGCIAMAVVLNRTLIFAATRRRLRLRWPTRLFLRLGPILLLSLQARTLLQSIQCQTSPDFAELRWGNASKSSELMFSHTNTFLHGLSSTLLLGATDRESCVAVHMVPRQPGEKTTELRGSLSRLWPLFETFCLSHFVETVSSAVQGRPVAAETGMTLFEHSLAFAEADATIGNHLGWGRFANASTSHRTTTDLGTSIAVTRSLIMRRVNTSPEVLLVAFLSAMNHITSHVLGIFDLQSRFRLLNTGFWAVCFMANIVWNVMTLSLDDSSTHGLLRYPAVCIVGFVPHGLVLLGIFTCGLIYTLALLLCAVSIPEGPPGSRRPSFRERLAIAHENMQANVSLSDVRIRMDMDFYTALLRAGFGAITMASEAVYLNEDRRVNLKPFTWLEDERLRELEETGMQWIGTSISASRYDDTGNNGLVSATNGQATGTSGYAREKVAQKTTKSGGNRRIQDGVGAAERSGRWVVAAEYMVRISRLVLAAWAVALCKVLGFFGVQSRPRWLRWLSLRPKTAGAAGSGEITADRDPTSELLAVRGVRDAIPRSDRVDVEAEVRRWFDRRQSGPDAPAGGPKVDENEIDETLYGWFLKGGWWGTSDSSGDYQPPAYQDDDGVEDPDFDTTSLASTTDTTDGGHSDWESDPEDLDDGQRTPTQQTRNPFAVQERSRESTPIVDIPLEVSDLARLLHPTSPEEREEAQALAAHLRSEGIMTRSAYRRFQQRRRIEVLTSGRRRPGFEFGNAGGRAAATRMSPEEEATLLEQILLSRRAAAAAAKSGAAEEREAQAAAASGSSWATGAAGLGPDGPQCVVCQSVPRSIILWPCRCLSLCDDCRVSLAMNNFDKCVCCRREVVSFSRIYVP